MKSFFLTFFLLFHIIPDGNSQKQISLHEIFNEYSFFPKTVQGIRSMKDGKHYTILNQYYSIEKSNYEKGAFIETVFSIRDLENPPFRFFEDYEFSADETKLLITTSIEPQYRHSFKATFYIYDLITKSLTPLSENNQQQIASFSPDGSRVAYMSENNLYIKDLISNNVQQITTDGEWNKIINGAPDWVYEEEFGYNKAFEWSPDSKLIAYCKFNESRVKQFNMTIYGELYPRWYEYKFPKAGEENSVVSVHVYDLESGETRRMDSGEETDQYIPRIRWTVNPEILSIIRLNRLQNKMEILHAEANTGRASLAYVESNAHYISEECIKTIEYLKNGNDFLMVSEQSGWRHIHLHNFVSGESLQITKGNYDIGEILSVDEKNGILYYSSHEGSPLRKHIFSINIDGSNKKKLTSNDGWNDAQFSHNSMFFILTHSNANKPFIFSLHSSDGKMIRTLEENTELVNLRKEYGFLMKEFFSFNTSCNTELNGYMIKPKGFNKKKKYPVFMYVYGGPESQQVTDMYSSRDNWFQLLADLGYLVVCVDNRGTDNRGEAFRKATYLQLGKLETEDQIEAAIYLQSLPFVNKNRIGIYGWSYGGYMSLLCLAKGSEIFKMAISVAPVTNWRFYDTIYTERFMRTPQENPKGYDDNSPINHIGKIKGKLLLVHGMADDNVHLQNSTELIDKLVETNKQFDMMFYPNKNHRIHGGNTSYHLHKKMTDFILNNL